MGNAGPVQPEIDGSLGRDQTAGTRRPGPGIAAEGRGARRLSASVVAVTPGVTLVSQRIYCRGLLALLDQEALP